MPAWLAWLVFVMAPAAATPTEAPIDAEALAATLDRLVPEKLRETGAPGVLVTVVQDDRVVLARGYGLADVARAIPMDAERTLFRAASISKTVTATAVAQLEAQGRVSLDAPVDVALDGWRVPPRFDTPVTLRHLLSHTGGFINHNIGRASPTPIADRFAAFMAETMAPQVYPPGRVVLYSNHGNALAGLAVEQVTGVPFARYVRDRLFEPLRMHDSTFALDPALADRVATGYLMDDGDPRPAEPLHVRTVPASGLVTTAHDLGRFMILLLSDGEVDHRRVIDAEALARMRTPDAGLHPALPAFHYAFAHTTVAGHPARRHGGSVPGYLSRMVLFDRHGVGIFVGHNAFGLGLRDELVDAIAEQVLPAPPPPPAVVPAGDGRPVDAAEIRGTYQPASIADTPGPSRALVQLGLDPWVVDQDDEGYLTLNGERFVRSGELLFQRAQEAGPPEALVFVRDGSGEVRWAHRGQSSAQRRSPLASPWVQWPIIGVALLVLALAASLGRGPIGGPAASRAERGLVIAAAGLALLGVVGPLVAIAWIDQGQPPLMRPLRFGPPWWWWPLRSTTGLGAALALGAMIVRARDPGPRRFAGGAPWVLGALTGLVLLQWAWSTAAAGLWPT